MRKQLAKLLLNEMQSNPNIYLITGDLGYGLWDDIMNTSKLSMITIFLENVTWALSALFHSFPFFLID